MHADLIPLPGQALQSTQLRPVRTISCYASPRKNLATSSSRKGAMMHSAVPIAGCLQRERLLLMVMPPRAPGLAFKRGPQPAGYIDTLKMCTSHRVSNGADCLLSWLALAELLSPCARHDL